MKPTSTPLCEAPICAIRGRHVDCADPDECWGCLRRQALDGARLCRVHIDRMAEDIETAPDLHEALAGVLVRRGTGGEKTSGSSSGAPVPDDLVMDLRGEIRRVLLELTKLVCQERGMSAPISQSDGRWFFDTRPAGLSTFLRRQVDWLAAHRDAGLHSNALHIATRGKVQSIAYPASSDKLYVGECPLLVVDHEGNESVCGTRLYQLPDRPLLQCEGCSTEETVEQWQRWLVGEPDAAADSIALAAHLALRWMRPVDPGTIRTWAFRGHIEPVTRPDPTPTDPDSRSVVRDERNRTLYSVAQVIAHATKAWGKPAG